MEAIGIALGEGVTSENFEERCYKALMDRIKSKNTADEGTQMSDPNMTNQPPGGQNPNPQLPKNPPMPMMAEQPPLYMSLDEGKIKAMRDPEQRQMAQMLFSLQQNAYNTAREKRQVQITRILRSLPATKREGFKTKILAMSAGAAFSMGSDGNVKDGMQEWLDLFEQNLPDFPELLREPSAHFSEVPHPKQQSDDVSAERIAEINAEKAKNLPHLRQKQAS
jgi:hypothetical protein